MLTRHGEKRVANRLGVGKKAAGKLSDLALADGTPREDTKGNLRRFLDRAFYAHGMSTFMVVYHGQVFVFGSKSGPLITAYPLPGNLMHSKAARSA